MAQNPFPNRIESNVLRGWILRALLLGVALGVVAGIVALLELRSSRFRFAGRRG